jgi:hypothetical protein
MCISSNASWLRQTYVGCDPNAASGISGRRSTDLVQKPANYILLDLTHGKYWRINPSRIFRGCILATAAMLLGYTITFTVLFGGPCNPLANEPVDVGASSKKKSILVVDEYAVDVVYKGRKDNRSCGDAGSGSGSTDSILGPVQSGHRAL